MPAAKLAEGDKTAALSDVESLGRRVDGLEERQQLTEVRFASVGSGKPSAQWGQVQGELERLRKLFEFVECVLPRDAAEAMRFFSQSCTSAGGGGRAEGADAGPAAGGESDARIPMGAMIELERQRVRLSETVQTHTADMRHEFENLTMAIRALQQDVTRTGQRIDDLASRLTVMEARPQERTLQLLREQPAAEEMAAAAAAATSPGGRRPQQRSSAEDAARPSTSPSGRAGEKPPAAVGGKGEGSWLGPAASSGADTVQLERHAAIDGPGAASVAFVSREAMHKAIDGLRDEVRNWLDVLHSSTVGGLHQKVDREELGRIARQLSETVAASGAPERGSALIAKRPLLGKCASCEMPLLSDPALERARSAASLGQPKAALPSATSVPNRAPDAKRVLVQGQQGRAKLPMILAAKDAPKDFPKGRVLRNSASQPDVRQPPSQPAAPSE